MRAIMFLGYGKGIEYRPDVPKPVPKAGEVLIKVKAAAICGTDVASWKWTDGGKNWCLKYANDKEQVFGHEFSGVIEALGEDVTGLELGARVSVETHLFCGKCFQCRNGDAHNCLHLGAYGYGVDGCFADYAVAPAKQVFVLPDGVSFEEAALLEPGCCAMFGVDESRLRPGDVAMVYGCGAIGQMAIQILYARGAKTVIAVDIDDYKCESAGKFGAVAVNSMKQDIGEVVKQYASERGGVDVIFEISGAGTIYDTLFDYLRPEGRVVLLAHPGAPVPIDMMKVHHKGATIKGVFGRRIWDSWANLIELIAQGKVELTKVVTHRFPLDKGMEAFEQTQKGAGKILLLPEM